MTAPQLTVQIQGQGVLNADYLNTLVQGGGIFLASLRGFTGTTNMTVFMCGYVSPADGGQGNFYWNSTTGTDDGGVTTIVPIGSTSGCWSRLTGNALSFTKINVQSFYNSGLYTPPPNLVYAIIKLVGGGGGGGAAPAGTSGQASCGGGGSSGAGAEGLFSAAQIGSSQSVIIGVGGIGGVAGANNGNVGTQTSFGALIFAEGGVGGQFGSASSANSFGAPGSGNAVLAAGGYANINGFNGSFGIGYPPAFGLGGKGGDAPFGLGSGGAGGLNDPGGSGLGYGSGAGGAGAITTAFYGGNGAPGACFVTEYIV